MNNVSWREPGRTVFYNYCRVSGNLLLQYDSGWSWQQQLDRYNLGDQKVSLSCTCFEEPWLFFLFASSPAHIVVFEKAKQWKRTIPWHPRSPHGCHSCCSFFMGRGDARLKIRCDRLIFSARNIRRRKAACRMIFLVSTQHNNRDCDSSSPPSTIQLCTVAAQCILFLATSKKSNRVRHREIRAQRRRLSSFPDSRGRVVNDQIFVRPHLS
jgi:hypothetical protein